MTLENRKTDIKLMWYFNKLARLDPRERNKMYVKE